MAEIKIEKKTPLWPWILLGIAIVGILIYLFAFNGNNDDTDDIQEVRIEQNIQEPEVKRQAAPNNSIVFAYVNFIKEDPKKMDLDHEFTNEALLKLINATSAMADEVGYDIQKDLEEVRTFANKITNDPFETTHANSIRKSADILAIVLHNIQRAAFPSLASEADEVKKAATAIQVEVLVLDQKESVKNYFSKSADLLEKMNNNSPQI